MLLPSAMSTTRIPSPPFSPSRLENMGIVSTISRQRHGPGPHIDTAHQPKEQQPCRPAVQRNLKHIHDISHNSAPHDAALIQHHVMGGVGKASEPGHDFQAHDQGKDAARHHCPGTESANRQQNRPSHGPLLSPFGCFPG